jgi:hypothetical protein
MFFRAPDGPDNFHTVFCFRAVQKRFGALYAARWFDLVVRNRP